MKRHLIAPSILSADFTRLGEQIQDAESSGADWIHIDIMDGHFAPNLSMGPLVVRACRQATSLPLDVHLMIEKPERFLANFAGAGADRITVHIETCPHIYGTLQSIRDLGASPGITLNPGTPLEALSEVLHLVDTILVMTVNPGFGGQTFLAPGLQRITTLAGWRNEGRTKALIEVDGGINSATIGAAAAAGADVFVAGSAVFNHPDGIRKAIGQLRNQLSAAAEG